MSKCLSCNAVVSHTAFGAIDIGMSLMTLFHQYGLRTYLEIRLLSTPGRMSVLVGAAVQQYTRVFVLLELWELRLAYVDHRYGNV